MTESSSICSDLSDSCDSSCDSLCDSSFDNLSVCDEIGQLVTKCEELHNHIHNSFETMHNIKELIKNRNNINVTYNEDITCDFDIVLEELHLKALENIKEKNQNNFGELLLEFIESGLFS
jgi:hypothetical protein